MMKVGAAEWINTSLKNNSFFYQFHLLQNIQIYKRYPDSVGQVILKVGGLKAFMGIVLIFMAMIHEYLFNRKLRKDLYSDELARSTIIQNNDSLLGTAEVRKPKAIEEEFSYEGFLKLKKKNRELSDELGKMREEIQTIKTHLKLY